MGLLSYIRGDDLRGTESRTLTRTNLPAPMLPYSAGAPIEVNEQTALRVADAYACVRVLADSISSLPLKAFRHLPAGRVPAGEESRIVQLLRSPSPGSTGVDLISQVMVHLTVHGDCFVGKFRSEGSIVQLALLDPQRVSVEMRGQRVVYTLRRDGGETEHGPDDILHIKAMSSDGLRGLSPVSQCRLALSLSSRLQESARQYFEHGSRPSGILTAQGASSVDALQSLSTQWSETHGGVENMHRVARALRRGELHAARLLRRRLPVPPAEGAERP